MIDPDIAIAGWRPLAGGDSARCFAVEVAGRKIVVKLGDLSTPTALPVADEFRLLEHASSIGVAPRPIGVDSKAGILLSELVESLPWAPGEFHEIDNVERLGRRLRMMHTIPTGIRPYEPIAFAKLYVESCDVRDRAQAEAWASELGERAQRLSDDPSEVVTCHNDLHSSNVLQTAELMFIDFEYAVTAPPIVDIASAIAMNRFDERQRDALVSAYYGDDVAPFDRDALANAVRMHDLVAELWRLSVAAQRQRVGHQNEINAWESVAHE